MDRLMSDRARLIVTCAFLLLVFFTGGSSRADMLSLVLLRPVSLLVLGYGLVSLTREDVRNNWPLVAVAIAAVALAALHLIPLPPSLWQSLPGRETIVQLDRLLALEDIWRPLSLDPQATRNALMAMAAPCAVLVLGIQLDERERRALLSFVLAVGALSAIWAFLQIMGRPHGPLYLYDVTSYASPVGLFANRNHHAVFLASLIPLVYCWTQLVPGAWNNLDTARGRRTCAAGAGILLLVPLILIIGSRAGLLTLIIAICSTAAVITLVLNATRARNRRRRSILLLIAPVVIGGLILSSLSILTVALGRDLAFERLLGTDSTANLRADLLPRTLDIIALNFPWGTGIGSFDDVYRMYEPDALLMPQYVNHAHNDVLELLMTGGVPGALILAFALGIFAVRAWAIARAGIAEIKDNIWSAAALVALAVLFVASLVDYPLRTPAMASYAVVLSLWACNARNATRP